MSRKTAGQQVGVALFPFLAVLICTMGALIVLLVLLVQQARVDASVLTSRQIGGTASGDEKQLRERLEDAAWQRSVLEKSRAEKMQELADARSKLAHLEEHTQRLEAQAQELLGRAKSIDEGKKLRDEDLAAARAEVQRLKADIEKRKAELEESKRKRSDKEQWYALIPYEGPQGTRRRPIYVECTEYGVVIQPEGIQLKSEDFSGPMGPGNPLDSALRAVREHIERTVGDKAGQPYPLLVVRPDGIMAYGAARAAMKAWDDEFGYELIGDDKQLDFGPPDPALAAALNKTVAVARERQAMMVAMMPRRFQNEEPLKSFAHEASPTATAPRPAGGGLGDGRNTALAGNGIGGGTYGTSAATPPSGRSGTSSFAGQGAESTGPSAWSQGTNGSTGQSSPSVYPAGQGSSPGQPSFGNSSETGSSSAQPNGSTFGASGANTSSPATFGQTATSGASSAGSTSFGGQPGAPGTPSVSLDLSPSKPPTSSSTPTSSKSSSKSSKAARGNNWALPNAKPHSVGVTRPIHIAVLADRIVVMPEKGEDRGPQVVRIAPELTQDDVNHFVTTIQTEIKGWGLAVLDGYWKPVLQAEVAPQAERHFMNLKTALEGSGMELVRKSP